MSSQLAPMIRLEPLPLEGLPPHDSLSGDASRPDTVKFALALLDQTYRITQPREFNLTFKHHSNKSSPPSNNEVEVLSTEVPASELTGIPWDSETVLRKKPAKFENEFWYARRSYHHNVSNKHNSPGTASWDEFQFGLLHNHSKHEKDFTETVYDARTAIDWNAYLQREDIAAQFKNRPPGQTRYEKVSMSIVEMCHKLPGIMSPRAFAVLVVTALVPDKQFLAVTIPVEISGLKEAFYSNGRNRTEGADAQSKKAAVMGLYCAVERVERYDPENDKYSGRVKKHTHAGANSQIEWIMGTASNAKGNLPMFMQRLALPGEVAKDVGRFLKWINKVSDEEIHSIVKHENGVGVGQPHDKS